MQTSRTSSKGQITLPRAVREKAGLEAGELVAYDVQDGVITLRRVEPFDAAFHRALSETLDEWNSPEDEEAFNGLSALGSSRRSILASQRDSEASDDQP